MFNKMGKINNVKLQKPGKITMNYNYKYWFTETKDMCMKMEFNCPVFSLVHEHGCMVENTPVSLDKCYIQVNMDDKCYLRSSS